MKLQNLLINYKKRMNATNDDIAEHVGVNKSTVSRWLKDDTKIMKPEVIEKLSFLLGTDVASIIKETDKYEKPVLGCVKAGYGLFAEENLLGYEDVSKSEFYTGDYFLRVQGNSMEGAHIHDQDLIYVRQCDDVPNGTIAVVLIGDEVTVKRIIKKSDFLILEAANATVSPRYFSQTEVVDLPVKIIGKVLYSKSEIGN